MNLIIVKHVVLLELSVQVVRIKMHHVVNVIDNLTVLNQEDAKVTAKTVMNRTIKVG